MFANASRAQIHDVAQRVGQLFLIDLAGPVSVDIDRKRMRDADRVGDLDGAAVSEAGRHDVLGQIPGGVGRRPIDLGRILARKRAAAMGRRTAIRVDNTCGRSILRPRPGRRRRNGRLD